jgi:hypothetical protein
MLFIVYLIKLRSYIVVMDIVVLDDSDVEILPPKISIKLRQRSMPWNMVIHLSLTKEMFIELMEVVEPSLLREDNRGILGNLIGP